MAALPFQTKERLGRFRQQQRVLQADRTELKRQLGETLASLRHSISRPSLSGHHCACGQKRSRFQRTTPYHSDPYTVGFISKLCRSNESLNGVSLGSELQLSRANQDAEIIEWINARIVRIEHSLPVSTSSLDSSLPQLEPRGRMTLEWDDSKAVKGAQLSPGEWVTASLPHPEFTAVLLDTWTSWTRHWY